MVVFKGWLESWCGGCDSCGGCGGVCGNSSDSGIGVNSVIVYTMHKKYASIFLVLLPVDSG